MQNTATELKVETKRESISQRILGILLKYENSLPSEAKAPKHLAHLRKIERAIALGKRIDLILPAFPAKSPNREKTLSALPDFAEVLGLLRLEKICRQIQKIYAPGARVVICSDGRVFSDLVEVSEEDVSDYQQGIIEIIQDFSLKNIITLQMEDLILDQTYQNMREQLVEQYGPSLEQVKASLINKNSLTMFNGIHRFIFEDRQALYPNNSRNRNREEAKEIAYQVIQRSNSWSALVEEAFPHGIRLSIHPQHAQGNKLGFRLVDCQNIWGTPWHNVAYLDAKGFSLVKRQEAEGKGAILSFMNNKYAYFKEPKL